MPRPSLKRYDVYACFCNGRESYRTSLVGKEQPRDTYAHIGEFTDYDARGAISQAARQMKWARKQGIRE